MSVPGLSSTELLGSICKTEFYLCKIQVQYEVIIILADLVCIRLLHFKGRKAVCMRGFPRGAEFITKHQATELDASPCYPVLGINAIAKHASRLWSLLYVFYLVQECGANGQPPRACKKVHAEDAEWKDLQVQPWHHFHSTMHTVLP